MNETHVTVVGNLVADPVLRVTPGQREVAGFRLASTVRRFDPEQGRAVDVRTSFFSVSCWGYLARNVSESVRKGERVVVSGRLELREYTGTDGQPRLSADVVADAVGPDLTYGTSRFTRVRRGSADPESASGAPPPTRGRPVRSTRPTRRSRASWPSRSGRRSPRSSCPSTAWSSTATAGCG